MLQVAGHTRYPLKFHVQSIAINRQIYCFLYFFYFCLTAWMMFQHLKLDHHLLQQFYLRKNRSDTIVSVLVSVVKDPSGKTNHFETDICYFSADDAVFQRARAMTVGSE